MTTEATIQQLFDLTGKVAMVTGGRGHLGSAISRALAEAGAQVIVTSRNERSAEKTVSELPVNGSESHAAVGLDQLDAKSVTKSFNAVAERFGAVDILVNNAHEHILSDLTNINAEDFNRQLSNATGYFLLARLTRDHAVQRDSPASVIMMGSMYGLVASYPDAYEGVSPASSVAYHALKGGILQMTRHLAAYWAKDHVRVNALSPGPFPAVTAPREQVERLRTRVPMSRMGMPFELKGAVVFLASDASSYVTGHNLVVDGGWTAW